LPHSAMQMSHLTTNLFDPIAHKGLFYSSHIVLAIPAFLMSGPIFSVIFMYFILHFPGAYLL